MGVKKWDVKVCLQVYGFATWCEAMALPRRTRQSPELGYAPRSGFALVIDAKVA
jgi:hypothetical protein